MEHQYGHRDVMWKPSIFNSRFPCHFPIYSPFLVFSETEMTDFPALQLMKSLPFQIPETW